MYYKKKDMKKNGKMIYIKEKDQHIIKMEIDMKEDGKMVNLKEKEYIIIKWRQI